MLQNVKLYSLLVLILQFLLPLFPKSMIAIHMILDLMIILQRAFNILDFKLEIPLLNLLIQSSHVYLIVSQELKLDLMMHINIYFVLSYFQK